MISDNLTKAREKAKQAEIDSEVGSDYNKSVTRRRKKNRKIYDRDDSDTSEGKPNDSVAAIVYPTPPATQMGSLSATSTSTNEERDIPLTEPPSDKDSNKANTSSVQNPLGHLSSTLGM